MKFFPVVVLGALVAILQPLENKISLAARGNAEQEQLATSEMTGLSAKQTSSSWTPSHLYRYFPAQEIYFEPRSGTYFFSDAGRWKSDARLPAKLKIEAGAFIVLGMDAARPYQFHGEIKAAFPTLVSMKPGPRTATMAVIRTRGNG